MSQGTIPMAIDFQSCSSTSFVFCLPGSLFKTYCVRSRDKPMLFPRAHAVPSLCQSCLALVVSLCRYKRPIEAARPQQTVLQGSGELANNKLPIM